MAPRMSEDDEFVISNELSRMDVDLIHSYLSEVSYWAQGISRERVERALKNSLCFGALAGDEQVGLVPGRRE